MAVKDGLPATDFSRMNREWVKAVAGGGSGGGGGLPDITAEDEGKVLTVENGEAAWAAGGGGGGVLYVINVNNETHALDKTFNEIYAAYLAGKICVIRTYYEADEEYGESYSYNTVVFASCGYTLAGEVEVGTVGTSVTNYSAYAGDDYPVVDE